MLVDTLENFLEQLGSMNGQRRKIAYKNYATSKRYNEASGRNKEHTNLRSTKAIDLFVAAVCDELNGETLKR